MPLYLVRLVQVYESFRKAELEALADLAGIPLEFVSYDEDVSSPTTFFGCIFHFCR